MKILVVEDELIISEDLCAMLEEHGYEICNQTIDYESSLDALDNDNPDLVLLDINLAGAKTGFDIAQHINKHHKIPFIYTSALSDAQSIAKAKLTRPSAYLVKPFKEEQLVAAIEVAMASFSVFKNQGADHAAMFNDAIFIKDGHRFVKLPLKDIRYLQKADNYIDIHTTSNRYTIRATMGSFLSKLNHPRMFKTHKSYAVNLDYLTKLGIKEVFIDKDSVPLSKNYLEALKEKLRIF